MAAMGSWVKLDKNTLYIVLILASLLGLALIFNITFIIAYNCRQTICTLKQKILIILLNVGALFTLATETYYKYYEHQQWELKGYNNVHCKAIKFIGCFCFGCYIYSLIALALDSVMRLQKTVHLGKVPELRTVHLVTPVVIILVVSSAVSVVPTVGYTFHQSENTTGICDQEDTKYDYYFLLYLKFHDIICLLLIPIIALQAVYFYSLSKFGCKAQDIARRIEDNEDVEFTQVLDAEMHWLLTVKWLVIVYTVVFLPLFFSKLSVTLINGGFAADLEVSNSIQIFTNRLIMILKGVIPLLSPIVLLVRLSWKKKEPVILETNL